MGCSRSKESFKEELVLQWNAQSLDDENIASKINEQVGSLDIFEVHMLGVQLQQNSIQLCNKLDRLLRPFQSL